MLPFRQHRLSSLVPHNNHYKSLARPLAASKPSSSSSSRAETPHCKQQTEADPNGSVQQPRQQQPRQWQQHQQQQQQQPRPQNKSNTNKSPSNHRRPSARSIGHMQLHELQDMVSSSQHNPQHKQHLPPSQLIAVVQRAAKLRPVLQPQQVQGLLMPVWEALQGRLSECQGYEVVLLVWAAAKLKYTPPPHTQPPTDLYSGALRHVLEAPGVLADLQPRSLSTLLYAVASAPPGVASQHWPAVVTQVLPALLQPDKMASCNSQDISNTLWALGNLGPDALQPLQASHDAQSVLQQLVTQLQAQLGTATPQAVSNTLWALARLAVYLPPALLLLALTHQLLSSTDRPPSAQDASSSIWALATLAVAQEQQQKVSGTSADLQQCVLRLLDVVAAPCDGRRPSCHSLALALWGTAKLGVSPPPKQLQRLLQLCVRQATAASLQDAANILWACAAMQQQQQQQQEGAAALSPVALLQQQQVDALLSSAAAGSKAQDAEPQAIRDTLWAVAKLGLQVQTVPLKALVRAFSAHAAAGAATARDLATVLWALATAHEQRRQQEEEREEWQGQEQQQQQPVEPVPVRVTVALVEAFLQQLQHSGSQEIATMLWGAAKLQHQLDAWVVQQLVTQLTAGWEGAQPPPATTTTTAAAAVSGAAASDASEQVQAASPQWQQQVTPQAASTVLWSVATLQQLHKQQQHQQQQQQQQRSPPIVLPLWQVQALLSVVMSQLQCVGDQELVNSLWAAARLEPQGVLPDGLLSQHLLGCIAARVGSMNLQSVASLAYTLGLLGVTEARDSLLPLLLQRGLHLVQQLTPTLTLTTTTTSSSSSNSSDAVRGSCRLHQAIANLCLAAAVLGVRGQADVLRGLAAAAATHCWRQMTVDGKRQLFMLHLELLLEEQQQQDGQQQLDRSLAGCLSPHQLQECQAAWLSGVCSSVTAPPSSTATATAGQPSKPTNRKLVGHTLQRKVFVAASELTGLAAAPAYEALTPDRMLCIDIDAVTQQGVQLAIEVDGPSHFRLPDLASTGSTLFRNRQLAARGYVVVVVPYFEWTAAVEEAQEEGAEWATQWRQHEQRRQGGAGGEDARIVAEGLQGVQYLQRLVDAALAGQAADSVVGRERAVVHGEQGDAGGVAAHGVEAAAEAVTHAQHGPGVGRRRRRLSKK